MAEQITKDAVNEAQSMGGPSPVDDTATTSSTITTGNGQAISNPSASTFNTSQTQDSSTAQAADQITPPIESYADGTSDNYGPEVSGVA